LFQRLVTVLAASSLATLAQAQALVRSVNGPAANAQFTRSAELDGTRAATFQCLGIAHCNLGEFESALAPLRRALELNPLDVLAHNGLGAAYQRMGCEDEARAAFHAALSIDPWFIDAWANLTLAARNFEEVIAAAEHVLELDPGQAGHRAMYGSALFNVGELRRARDEFARLVVSHGENPMYWFTYAGALAQSGELQTAWDALQHAKGLEPNLPGLGPFEEDLRAALQSGQ